MCESLTDWTFLINKRVRLQVYDQEFGGTVLGIEPNGWILLQIGDGSWDSKKWSISCSHIIAYTVEEKKNETE